MTTPKSDSTKSNASFDTSFPNMFKDMFANFKIPGVNLEQIADQYRANLESVIKANQVAASGMTELGKRQAEIYRQTLDQAMEIVKHSFEDVSPEKRMVKQTELAKLAFDKAISNAKDLSEIATKSGKDAGEVIQQRIKASLDELQKIAKKS